MKTRVVHYYSEGSRLEADYYLPDDLKPGEKRPAVVLAHGYTGIRGLILPDYAKYFTDAGYVAVGFDYRGFGGSEGVKWRLIQLEQVDDIRNTITWLENQPEVDPSRIALWGTSNGGAHAPYVAAVDTRVKVAIGQVGYGDGRRLIMDIRSPEERKEVERRIAEDRRARVLTGKGTAADTATVLASPQTQEFFKEALKILPDFYCEVSWESPEKTLEYRPIDVVHQISPRALLLIAAKNDDLCQASGFQDLYDHAKEPKQIEILPITHYQIYTPEWVDVSAKLAVEFCKKHL